MVLKFKRIHLLAALAGLFVLFLFLLFFRSSSTSKQFVEAPPVYVGKVEQKDVAEDISTVGKVESFAKVEVKSRVEGQLTAIHFEEGAYVKRGEPLFTIDERPYQAKVDEASATLARDQANLNKAREDLRRYTSLLKQEAISRQEYDQALATAKSLEATVNSNVAALDNSKLQLEFCSINAPISGRTGRILVREGNIVKANADTPLVTIEQMQPVRVLFPVPERYLGQIVERMKAEPLNVTARTAQSADTPEQGVLSFIDNSVDSPTGTILLKAVFENKAEKLWPGQFVEVSLHVDTLKNSLLVPNQAVQQSQNGPYVYTVSQSLSAGEPAFTVQLKHIKTGYVAKGYTVVLEGLSKDEIVVTDGQMRLTPGTQVRVLASDAKPSQKESSP